MIHIPEDANVLFLDDDETRAKAFKRLVPSAVTVSTAKACIAKLGQGSWDAVFLDHDLGGEAFVSDKRADTGSGVARWIAENKPSIGNIVVHSLNPAGAENMVQTLKKAGYNVHRIAFYDLFK